MININYNVIIVISVTQELLYIFFWYSIISNVILDLLILFIEII